MKLYFICIFSLIAILSSCHKEEIISTVSNKGVLLGYGSSGFVNNGAMNWGIIDYNTGTAKYSSSLPNMSSVYNQAMYTPDSKYYIPTPFNQLSAPGTKSYIKWIDKNTLQKDSADAKSKLTSGFYDYTTCLTYSPVSQKTYALQGDTLFDYTINASATPKTIVKGTKYAPIGLGSQYYSYSSTADAKLPFIYIAAINTIKKIDITTSTISNVSAIDSFNMYYGIRYNLFDDKVYVINAINNGIDSVAVLLQRINNNTLETVATFPFTSFNSDTYTAAIHCCENKYILFMNGIFYNVDIASGLVTEVVSTEKHQGLIWIKK